MGLDIGNLIEDKATETSSRPGWYSGAGQSVLGEVASAATHAPKPTDTAASQLGAQWAKGSTPFSAAQTGLQNTLNQASSDPYTRDASGKVTGYNPNSYLGGLYQAQQNYFNQLLPQVDAQPMAGAIGSGQFGGLRNLTALGKARGDALAQMQQDQYKTALSSLDQQIKAAAGLGNIGTEQADALTKLGTWQLTAPYVGAKTQSDIVGNLAPTAPTQTSKQTNLSPLSQISAIGNMLGNPKLAQGLSSLGINSVSDFLSKTFGGGGGSAAGSRPASGGGSAGGGGLAPVTLGNQNQGGSSPTIPVDTSDAPEWWNSYAGPDEQPDWSAYESYD